jgi:hypothetical protein
MKPMRRILKEHFALRAVVALVVACLVSFATRPAAQARVARAQGGDATTRSRASYGLRHDRGASDCSSYKGPRLYASGFYPNKPATFQTWPLKARDYTAPICSFTTSTTTQVVGGMTTGIAGKLWVVDSYNAVLDAFPKGTNGVVTPTQTISGDRTLLLGLNGAQRQDPATDSVGNVWVPQWYEFGGYIMAFSNNAKGNVAPVATIGYADKGDSEGFLDPTAVTFDSSGNLYVLNGSPPASLLVFTPPFSDTELPVAVWSTGLNLGFFVTSDGTNIYAGNNTNCVVFDGGLSSGGVISRSFTVDPVGRGGGGAYDLKADPKGRLYFSMVSPPRRYHYEAIGILRPGATSTKHVQFLFSIDSDDALGSLAISE